MKRRLQSRKAFVDIRLLQFNFNKNIETNLPKRKNIQKDDLFPSRREEKVQEDDVYYSNQCTCKVLVMVYIQGEFGPMAGPMVGGKGGGEQPCEGGECGGGRSGGRGLSGDCSRWEWKGLRLCRGRE